MALSEDIDELRKLLDLRTGERDRIQQQLEETTTKLADPDGPAVGRLLATKQKLEATLDRLNVEIPAITGRIEILADRLAAEETAAEIERLQVIVAQSREAISPFLAMFEEKKAEIETLLGQLREAGIPGNHAAEKIRLLTAGSQPRPVLVLPAVEGWHPPKMPWLYEIPNRPEEVHLYEADYALCSKALVPPWRKPAEPAAVEPEQADAELNEEPIAS